jgi:beta-phosphoglucomutase
MDGVLVDAREWHFEALNKALNIFGYEISRSDHLATFDGLPTTRKLEILSSNSNLPLQLHGFINELKQIYTTDIALLKCIPTFCHEYALSRLKREGFRLAVCSNSIRSTVSLMLSRSALIDYFEFYLSNQDVVKAKPHPEIYAKAIERFGVNPDECLVLEDNPNGIKAAMDAGTYVMQVRQIGDVSYEKITKFIQHIEAKSC